METLREILISNPDVINNLNTHDFDILQSMLWRDVFARKNQIEPVELGKNGKFIWLAKCGRGFGKTRMFAEWVIEKVRDYGYRYVSLVGAAADEVRTIMIEGESGILSCSPNGFKPHYEPSKKQMLWPNGARAQIYYGTEPDKARGAQSDLIWGDEYCKWQYPQETLDNLLFGLRLGKNPLCGISTTPKPTKAVRDMVKRDDIIVTEGNTFDNIDNLADPFIKTIIAKYRGTRLEQQEIYAKILDDNPNALWQRKYIDDNRVVGSPELTRVIVAIDPAASDNDESNETGIIIAGKSMRQRDEAHFYILDDMTISGTPEAWARQAIAGYNKYRADRIIAEKNNGGDMVKSTLQNVSRSIPIELVWASRGKITRAEPISLLYEQGRVHHVGTFESLEDQLCEWSPGDKSPDRMDACVWAITALMEGFQPDAYDANGRLIT